MGTGDSDLECKNSMKEVVGRSMSSGLGGLHMKGVPLQDSGLPGPAGFQDVKASKIQKVKVED